MVLKLLYVLNLLLYLNEFESWKNGLVYLKWCKNYF